VGVRQNWFIESVCRGTGYYFSGTLEQALIDAQQMSSQYDHYSVWTEGNTKIAVVCRECILWCSIPYDVETVK
jgi:hypothetical protein